MEIDVLISTAGEGKRLHKINSEINKSLLPYLNKPIIQHIIEKIPNDLNIGVLLGYKSQQVKDYLILAFPSRKITFINIDDWTSNKSGTKYSLMSARKFLRQSFWYFPCDGIYENTNFMSAHFSEDVFIVDKIDHNQAIHYLTFTLDENRISEQYFKSNGVGGEYAFTGVMKIKNKDEFFNKLEASNSNEFVSIIPNQSLTYNADGWKDFGNHEKYIEEISKTEGFDFSKSGEYTYQLNDKIIKWWADPDISNQKLEKPRIKPDVFPKGIESLNQFLFYAKAPGAPFYESLSPEKFNSLLDWLKNKVWFPAEIDIKQHLSLFYKEKSISRINLLGDRKEFEDYKPKYINNVKVEPWQYYFDHIKWSYLIEENYPSFIHGDLQFDNIIYDQTTEEFTLIDWRHDFSGLKSIGDLYYDFAKMLGGIYVNYQQIKKGNFNFDCTNHKVSFELPEINKKNELISILELHVKQIGLDFRKVQELVPLIFWNMAPLHKEPFSNLCWSLGVLHYEILDQG